jgi:hypothetical protein
MSHRKKKWLSTKHSITRPYSPIRSIDRQFVNRTKNGMYKQAAVLTAECYNKHANTLIPPLVQSKLSIVGGPKLHAPESNAELAISPKKIISSMLAPIPVNTRKKLICKFSLPLLSLCTVNTVTHSYDISAVLPQFLLAKDRRKPAILFSSVLFSASPCAKFHV